MFFLTCFIHDLKPNKQTILWHHLSHDVPLKAIKFVFLQESLRDLSVPASPVSVHLHQGCQAF